MPPSDTNTPNPHPSRFAGFNFRVGAYKCDLTTQTPPVKEAHMRLSCCLRQWISAPTARSTAAVGGAPLDIVARTHARMHIRTRTLAFTVSSQSHCQKQFPLVKLKCAFDSEKSSFKSDFSTVSCFKPCQSEQRLELHFCRQLPSNDLSPILGNGRFFLHFSFQGFCLILVNIFFPSSSNKEALSDAASGVYS